MRNVKLPQVRISCQAGNNATRVSLAGGGVSSPGCRRSLWWCPFYWLLAPITGRGDLTRVYHSCTIYDTGMRPEGKGVIMRKCYYCKKPAKLTKVGRAKPHMACHWCLKKVGTGELEVE